MRRQDEFETELVSHRAFLLGIARWRTKSATSAEDLVQDTFVRAIANRASFVMGTNMRAWLAFILRNGHLSDLRRAWRSVQMPEGLAERTPVTASQHSIVELRELLEAVALLDPTQREALLCVADGEDYEHAAAILGTSIGTVKSRVSRARNQLDIYFGELS